MRARRKNWTETEIATNSRIIKGAALHKGMWRQYFNNDNPIHLEIGCGKGRFIVATAAANPQVNYLAMEREEHVIVMGARVSKDIDCALGFIISDVKDINDIISNGELSRIYINFCDPWPNRKKWHKRRLTHRGFLDMYENLLDDNGEIFFKTDNKELFEFSLNEFSDKGWRLRNITLDLHNSGMEGNIKTEYEEKFSSIGMPIYRCECIVPKAFNRL